MTLPTGTPRAGSASLLREVDWADHILSVILREGRNIAELPGGKSTVKSVSDFSRRHLINATLMSALPHSGLPRGLIAELTERMREGCDNQDALHRQLAAVIAEIQPALDRDCIRWRLIKGPHLQQAYYGALAREYFDLDILVPRDQFTRAQSVFERLGWHPRRRGFVPLALVRPFQHDLGLARGEAIVDLHWTLRVRPAYRIDEERLFAGDRTSLVGGVAVRVPEPEYDLTLCLLSIAQGIERERAQLRDAIDLYLILRSVDSRISWRSFFHERQRERTERICASLLAAAVSWLDGSGALPNLRGELQSMGFALSSTEANPLKSCVCLQNVRGAGRRWYLSVYPGGKLSYWLHASASVIGNQEFPYNLPRTFLFRRLMGQ